MNGLLHIQIIQLQIILNIDREDYMKKFIMLLNIVKIN